MLTKDLVVGLVSVLPDTMQLQVREDVIVREDGVELSRTYHRYVASPGEDVSTRAPIVQQLAALLWTPEVIAAAQARQASDLETLLAGLPTAGGPS